MRTDKLMPMLLQLFDGEGGAADGTGSAPATQNNTADNTAPATQDGAHESTAEDLDKEFKALIKDKYKNAYQKHINAAMQKRFRADEAAQAQYDRVLPLLDMLGEKYGADATDPEALMQALEDDNSFYEQESVEKGVPIESLKQMHKLERENAAFRQEMQERERQDAAAQQYQQWLDESEAVKSLYGDAFDLDAVLHDHIIERGSLQHIGVLNVVTILAHSGLNGGHSPFGAIRRYAFNKRGKSRRQAGKLTPLCYLAGAARNGLFLPELTMHQLGLGVLQQLLNVIFLDFSRKAGVSRCSHVGGAIEQLQVHFLIHVSSVSDRGSVFTCR